MRKRNLLWAVCGAGAVLILGLIAFVWVLRRIVATPKGRVDRLDQAIQAFFVRFKAHETLPRQQGRLDPESLFSPRCQSLYLPAAPESSFRDWQSAMVTGVAQQRHDGCACRPPSSRFQRPNTQRPDSRPCPSFSDFSKKGIPARSCVSNLLSPLGSSRQYSS